MGSLSFTHEQSRLMRRRLDRGTFPVQMTAFEKKGIYSREY